MEKVGIIISCIFALIQVLAAEPPKIPGDLPPVPRPHLPPPGPHHPPVKPPKEFINTNPADFNVQPEVQIIEHCKNIPSKYEELLTAYSGSLSGQSSENVRVIESELNSQLNELLVLAKQYQSQISSVDPNAESLQNYMASAISEIQQSIEQVDSMQFTGTDESINVQERVSALEQNVGPAISRLEEFCLVETEDILKNILNQYESVNAMNEYQATVNSVSV